MYGIYPNVEIGWLHTEITLEEAERIIRRYVVVFDDALTRANGGLPDKKWVERKAILATEWDAFKEQLRPGDILRLFNTGGETIRNRTSMGGIALVRDGTIITHVTLMSD